MNKVFLIGNLTRDPELKSTSAGTPVCNFTVAVNRRFRNSQTGQQETDFLNVVAWRQLAELCSRYLSKGRKVAVTGSIQTRTYEAKDGAKRVAWDIVAEEVEFLTSQSQKNSGSFGAPTSAPRRDKRRRYRVRAKAASMAVGSPAPSVGLCLSGWGVPAGYPRRAAEDTASGREPPPDLPTARLTGWARV